MLQLVNALDSKNPKYLRQLKRLFKQAFPRFERKPWWLLQRTAAAGQAELLAVCDSNQPGRFCGLAICLFWQDLVLLDYEMPVCDGRQALEMIRSEETTAGIPVMFLTGRGDRESVKKVMDLKPEGYLLKTMPEESIKKMIDDFFEKRK